MDFDERIKTIANMPQNDYEDLLVRIIAKHHKEGFNEVLFNLRDKNRLSLMRFIVSLNAKFKELGKVVPLLKISATTIDSVGGFHLTNGENVIDCSLETLINNGEELLPV